jgi:hypothetical protein
VSKEERDRELFYDNLVREHGQELVPIPTKVTEGRMMSLNRKIRGPP